MRDSYRALRPGGRFRIVIPDFRACFEAYARHDADFFSLIDLHVLYPGPEAKPLTLVDFLNYSVYQFGEHRCLYDEEKLFAVLGSLGFHSMERSEFDASIDIGEPLRTRYSLYFEARR
jgi:predicted SAM-dependent methyltransferase